MLFYFIQFSDDVGNQKDDKKEYRYEPLKNFSIAKVWIPEKGQTLRTNKKLKKHNSQPDKGKKPDNDPDLRTDVAKLQKQTSMIDLTEEEKLELQFVLTAQNCADCGLW